MPQADASPTLPCLEVLRGDHTARPQKGHATQPRQVDQHAARHYAVAHRVHPVPQRHAGRITLGRAVVGAPAVTQVRKRIDVRHGPAVKDEADPLDRPYHRAVAGAENAVGRDDEVHDAGLERARHVAGHHLSCQ